MAVEIPLTQGKVALVDDEDAERVRASARPRWRAERAKSGLWYAVTGQPRDGTFVRMHRLVGGGRVDHVNGDGLDNRRVNLRPATQQQNLRNRRPIGGRDVKGVSRDADTPRRKPWRARIKVDGKEKFLGRFATKGEAARAYDDAARELFGDFARLNGVGQGVIDG